MNKRITLNRNVEVFDFNNSKEGKRIYLKFDYANSDKKFLINRVSKGFTLYNELFETLITRKTLTEIKNFIVEFKEIQSKIDYNSVYSLDGFIEILQCQNTLNEMIGMSTHYTQNDLEIANTFKNIATENNLIISKSPYSNSFYAHKEGEEITWGYKPLDSYRLADHWNFGIEKHCPSDCNDKKFTICKFDGELYRELKRD